ncbi:lytic murein transglycosylase [Mesorhizobium sp. WSM3862]|nr:lytic murein transglycosylase [Mesorhizobium sp. WSM3862]
MTLGTPLCPAGHLPRNGEDWRLLRSRKSCSVGDWRNRENQLISPLAGETAGRPEGGA